MIKRKKLFLLLLALTLACTSLGAAPLRLVRLKVINKSGMGLEISLNGKYFEYFYYLHMPKGTRQVPAVEIYTVIPDTYSSSIYFVELWDPVYGHKCTDKSQTLDVERNVSLVVLECNINPPNAGEQPATIKYSAHPGKRGH
jgi:hypothetical protein